MYHPWHVGADQILVSTDNDNDDINYHHASTVQTIYTWENPTYAYVLHVIQRTVVQYVGLKRVFDKRATYLPFITKCNVLED